MNGKRPSYQFRDYKALECKAFVDFIDEECWQRLHECSDVDVHARTLDSVLRDGLNQFGRCSTRLTSTAKSKSYKYDRSVAEAKAIRRKFGTKLNQIKSNQVVDKQLLKAQRYRVRKLALKSQGRHIFVRRLSTVLETALLDAYAILLSARDSGKSAFLVLLDLPAADTISHS